MKKFEDQGQGGMLITESEMGISLTPAETYALWEWLSARKDSLQAHAHGEQLEIRLYQDDLSYLDELKSAIPGLHDRGPVARVLDVCRESVSERALQLLKIYELEYHIHPLLEDENTFAQ